MNKDQQQSRSDEVTITLSGPVGSGKSALLGEIEILLKALKVPYRFADEAGARSEKNMTHADWTVELERTQPRVVLVESTPRSERGTWKEIDFDKMENVPTHYVGSGDLAKPIVTLLKDGRWFWHDALEPIPAERHSTDG